MSISSSRLSGQTLNFGGPANIWLAAEYSKGHRSKIYTGFGRRITSSGSLKATEAERNHSTTQMPSFDCERRRNLNDLVKAYWPLVKARVEKAHAEQFRARACNSPPNAGVDLRAMPLR